MTTTQKHSHLLLPDTVWPEDAGDLALDRDRETVEDEPVLAIAESRLVELFREVDDIERLERAFLDADTAAYAELLGSTIRDELLTVRELRERAGRAAARPHLSRDPMAEQESDELRIRAGDP